MTTLDQASKRLAEALDALERKVAAAAQAPAGDASGEMQAEIESLRTQLADLTSEYDSLLERYESLVERNVSLSDRLDGTINRLRNAGHAYAES